MKSGNGSERDYPIVWLRPRASDIGHGRVKPVEGRMNTAACPSPNQKRTADSRATERAFNRASNSEPIRRRKQFPNRWTRYTERS